ncbi:hypothetical protein NMG60_11029168 [Bertholletia excelsa]
MLRLRGTSSSTKCHLAYGFLIASMLALLRLKYQGKNTSPFDTHPTNMAAFLVTVCTYTAALIAELITAQTRWRRYPAIFGRIAAISTALSTASLGTVFLPSAVGCILVFSLWVLMLLWTARQLVWAFYLVLYNTLAIVVVQLIHAFVGPVEQNLEEHPDSLV